MSFPFPRPFPGPSMVSWGVLSLFSSGEQGAWYDPSDFSTMFQDSAGTTPVTAVEQPVGLLLDKSKGLALGAEIYVGLQTGTWIAGSSTITGENTYVTSSTVGPYKAGILTIGKWYKITYDIAATSSNQIRFVDSAVPAASPVIHTTSAGGGTGTFYFAAASTGLYLRSSVGVSSTVTINSLSVRELPGNHASQSTAASRPVLSARVNQLTFSEDFSNGVWTPRVGNATRTVNTLTSTTVNGGHYVGVQGVATTAGAQYVWSCSFKPNGYDYVGLYFYDVTTGNATSKSFRIDTGTIVSQVEPDAGLTSTATISGPDVDGYYRCAITTAAVPGGSAIFDIRLYNNVPAASYVGNGVSGVYATKADLRVTNVGVNLPAYQRVGAATDYDTSGFPLYLKFDGVDDGLVTGTIDFSATDKMSVFAGHRIVFGTGSQIICELGTDAFASSGFNFGQGVAAATSGLGFIMNAGSGIAAQTADKSVPYTSVLSLLLNSAQSGISNEGILRSNTILQTYTATAGTDSGTANFPNKNLYLGSRAGSAFRYNGYLYSLIVRGAQSTDAQIASTETYVNNMTKAY